MRQHTNDQDRDSKSEKRLNVRFHELPCSNVEYQRTFLFLILGMKLKHQKESNFLMKT